MNGHWMERMVRSSSRFSQTSRTHHLNRMYRTNRIHRPSRKIHLNRMIPGISDGPTKEELAKEIQEKEERLKELELEQRTAELELKQLKKKVDNAIVTSTVEGTVKSVTDEETARLENTPIISVVGEDGFYVTGRVAETAFDKIKEGMTVTGITSWSCWGR